MMKTYPFKILDLDLGKWGKIKYRQWFYKDDPRVPTEDWVDLFVPFIKPGSFVVDVGAFIGDTTIPFALLTGHQGKVLAFEPGPASYPFLVENTVLNGLTQIDPVQKAITGKPGQYLFHYTDEGFINGGFSSILDIKPGGCGNTHPFEVQGVNLTEYLTLHYACWLPKISFLKIDTEGYDKEILKQNASLIRHFHPIVQVEVYPFLSQRERLDLMKSVQAIGYIWDGGESVFLNAIPKAIDVICRPQT